MKRSFTNITPLPILLFISTLFVIFPNFMNGQQTSADVISASIAYHDPQGILEHKKVTMYFTETRPNGSDRKSNVLIDLPKELYIINREVDDHLVSMQWHKNKSRFELNGKTALSADQIKKHNLNNERLHKMKDYYRYLWHLPMTLTDPGTIVSKQVKTASFNNRETLEIKVTYDPDVGKDIWYFYFDPQTYALVGYRFYHDESINDGEYIILTEEFQSGTLRLPKKRAWYMHTDEKYLGEDILKDIKIQ